MEPIIRYQGELYQGLRALMLALGSSVNKVWIAGGLGWLLLVCGWALWSLRLPGKERAVRWWLPLLLLGIVVIRLPLLGVDEQNTDESQWVASAGTLIADPRFWISVDGTTSGPLNVYPLTLPWFFGLSIDFATIRLVGLLAFAAAVGLLYRAFANLAGSRRARIAVLPFAVAIAFMQQGDGPAYNSEHFPSLLFATILWLRSTVFWRPEPVWKTVLTGFLLGCIPYTKLQAVPLALVLTGGIFLQLLLTTPPERRWRLLLALTVGGLLPSGLLGIYLWQTSNFEFFYKSFLLANLGYAQKGSFGNGVQNWSEKLTVLVPVIFAAFGSTKAFFFALPAMVLAALGLVLVNPSWRRKRTGGTSDEGINPLTPRVLLVFSILWLLTALYSVLQPGNGFYHYQILSYIPAFWLAGLVIMLGLDAVRTGWRMPLAAGWLLLLAVGPGLILGSRRNSGIRQLIEGVRLKDSGLTAAVAQYTVPNDKMVVWGWQNKYHVWTGLLMGSRFIPLYYPVVESELQPYFMKLHQQDIVRNRPAIIVDATASHPGYHSFQPEWYPFMRKLLAAEYRHVGTLGGSRLFVRKDRVAPSR
ncbi:hypothetical protein [Tellurirhabdus rosea]|uniref:hypothetical protein n=1 Tax=Tellurirhabdus rosea TaxID=2674997 RepID=UPI002255A835|nr:hypothetical protein [Tellurirhabdus rosea]